MGSTKKSKKSHRGRKSKDGKNRNSTKSSNRDYSRQDMSSASLSYSKRNGLSSIAPATPVYLLAPAQTTAPRPVFQVQPPTNQVMVNTAMGTPFCGPATNALGQTGQPVEQSFQPAPYFSGQSQMIMCPQCNMMVNTTITFTSGTCTYILCFLTVP